MQYSEDFKRRVLAALGGNGELREALDNGQEIVGRYLDDARQRQMGIKKLYSEWLDIHRNQHSDKQGLLVYPEDFKQRVLAALGGNGELREALDNGQEIVGRYLDDARQRQMASEELYREWLGLYHSQYSDQLGKHR